MKESNTHRERERWEEERKEHNLKWNHFWRLRLRKIINRESVNVR